MNPVRGSNQCIGNYHQSLQSPLQLDQPSRSGAFGLAEAGRLASVLVCLRILSMCSSALLREMPPPLTSSLTALYSLSLELIFRHIMKFSITVSRSSVVGTMRSFQRRTSDSSLLIGVECRGVLGWCGLSPGWSCLLLAAGGWLRRLVDGGEGEPAHAPPSPPAFLAPLRRLWAASTCLFSSGHAPKRLPHSQHCLRHSNRFTHT
jgi:hypothetical protein